MAAGGGPKRRRPGSPKGKGQEEHWSIKRRLVGDRVRGGNREGCQNEQKLGTPGQMMTNHARNKERKAWGRYELAGRDSRKAREAKHK